MKKKYKVGSRSSALALAQTNWVINEIKKNFPELEFEIIKFKTEGDMVINKALYNFGGKGLFVKELEKAIIKKEIDFAVNSMKDMPIVIPEELCICAVSVREDPRDVLILNQKKTLADLEYGATIGTSSLRRELQILSMRPDLKIKLLRGNILTRLRKLYNKKYDGIIIAAAGLNRLGIKNLYCHYFNVKDMIPAPGQGILGIEVLKGVDVSFLIKCLHNETSALELKAERAFMSKLGADCNTPVGAYAYIEKDTLNLLGMYATKNSKQYIKSQICGNKNDAELLGEKLADEILNKISSVDKKF